jgi:hypothetical protein
LAEVSQDDVENVAAFASASEMGLVEGSGDQFRVPDQNVRVFHAQLSVFGIGFALGFQVRFDRTFSVGAEDEAADLLTGPQASGLNMTVIYATCAQSTFFLQVGSLHTRAQRVSEVLRNSVLFLTFRMQGVGRWICMCVSVSASSDPAN